MCNFKFNDHPNEWSSGSTGSPDETVLAHSSGNQGTLCGMNEAEVMNICGEAGIRRMVAAFYHRVRTDDLIGPMYPEDDWEGSEERLAEFLLYRLGGSTRYLEMRGHPRLRMRHITFQIGIAERDRWLSLMGAAMEDAEIPRPARSFLDPFFGQVADFMRNRPEPPVQPNGA